MSERLITLSNVPGRQFTQKELQGFQAEGVKFNFEELDDHFGPWDFGSLYDKYFVALESMELFNKLANPTPEVSTEVATAVAGEFVIPDKFTFFHKDRDEPQYHANKEGDLYVVSWTNNNSHTSSTTYPVGSVSSAIKSRDWINVKEVLLVLTFEDVKLKLKEAQKALVEAQQSVAQYEKLYKELVAAEEFGFVFSKKA
mgnify:CR=1 FL=1